MEQVYLGSRTFDNPFIHHFRLENGDKAVENSPRRWIRCGQPVDNPLSALLERAKREEEHETKIPNIGSWEERHEHKKREPTDGSLVANTIKYTLFSSKNQALPLLCRREGLKLWSSGVRLAVLSEQTATNQTPSQARAACIQYLIQDPMAAPLWFFLFQLYQISLFLATQPQTGRNGGSFVKRAFRFGFGHFLLLPLPSSSSASHDLLHNLFYTLMSLCSKQQYFPSIFY